MSEAALLEVRDLSVRYGQHTVVDRISLSLAPGRCLGIIGESGAGKSQAFLAMMGLSAGAHVDGSVRLADQNLLTNAAQLRGRRVAMIFQDPLTSLTPHLRIGAQIAESLRQHRGMSRREAMQQAAQLLGQVRVNDVPRRLRHIHRLSRHGQRS